MTSYFMLLRPRQWVKNLMLFFPPFLGGTLLQPGVAARGLFPLVAFCLASSSLYVVNDLCDRENDGRHPKKRLRPLPSGRVTPVAASALSVACATASALVALSTSFHFFCYLMAYFAVSIAYSLRLKNIAIVDIFCISAGFLIRLLAGGAVFGMVITHWLFLTVFLLSVFLSAGKRCGEKNALGETAVQHRKALDAYSEKFLAGIMNMTGSAVLVTYTMYVIARPSRLLIYTVPLSCFGLFRYIYRIHSGAEGDPTESLTRDPAMFAIGVLWVTMVGWGIYGVQF